MVLRNNNMSTSEQAMEPDATAKGSTQSETEVDSKKAEFYEKQAAKQLKRGKEISTILRNIKKDSASRKNQTYIEKRMSSVAEIWEDFKDCHNALVEVIPPEHNYIKQKLFEQVRQYVQLIKENLEIATEKMAIKEKQTFQQKRDEQQSFILEDDSELIDDDSSVQGDQNKKLQQLKIKQNSILRTIDEIKIHLNAVNTNPTFLKYKRKQLEEKWSNIGSLSEELAAELETESEDILTEFEHLENVVTDTVIIVNEMLNEGAEKNQEKIRLPAITVPFFNGGYENWTTFHDIFVSIIHTNKKLSGAEKMQYLKTSLKGEAAKLIQHLSPTNQNYETSWDLICHRYNNQRLILANYLDKFLNLPKLNDESSKLLRRIHDTTNEIMCAIHNMGIDNTNWGPLVMHIIIQKLDKVTLRAYEQSLNEPTKIQPLNELLKFIETRFQSLETITNEKGKQNNQNKNEKPNPEKQQQQWSVRNYHANTAACTICKGLHGIFGCKKFTEMSTWDRNQTVKTSKLCRNCLKHSETDKCISKSRCQKCDKAHHTLLHYEQKSAKPNKVEAHTTTTDENQTVPEPITVCAGRLQNKVLLATALIMARDIKGEFQMLRVLLDQGSQASFISENAAQRLSLPRTKIFAEVSGVGSSKAGTAKGKIEIQLKPRFPSNFEYTCAALILPKLTTTLPKDNLQTIPNMQNHIVADPTYCDPGPIDMIIGADIYGSIILDGIKKFENGLLSQKTEFGWIFSGVISQHENEFKIVSMVATADEDKMLARFWELEDAESKNTKAAEENEKCEKLYGKTYTRDANGRYTVKMPFKDEYPNIGESRNRAIARFLQMERKFAIDRKFADEYKKFIDEYIDLGHMVPVQNCNDTSNCYYIPHQAVIRESSTTTKLRVVFDASSKASNGSSLNELMYSGPRLQDDLATILLRWRKHKYVLTADVEKMYRQIRMHEDHQDFQRIIWRPCRNEPLKEFKLTTVTYGTSSAPYLAIKILRQLAMDEQQNWPKASEVTLRDYYVDDLMTGGDTYEETKQLQQDLIQLMKAGGLNLRKWSSNYKKLTNDLPSELLDKEIGEIETKKILGVHWNPNSDNFKFKVNLEPTYKVTKRAIISDIARLFDPLGWISPIAIVAKMIVQEIWISHTGWDEVVPKFIEEKWHKFRSELGQIENITIPRWINCGNDILSFQIHGFCDASEKAYGAVIYSRITSGNGQIFVQILKSKSNVAPLKMKTTLPRLELCGATLLAKMLKNVKTTLGVLESDIYAWSDSTITLAWIKGEQKWTSFVTARTTEILCHTKADNWHHVRSKQNPADIISRGIEAQQLVNRKLWWQGPEWLQSSEDTWPLMQNTLYATTEELKHNIASYSTAILKPVDNDIILRFSSFRRLIRVVAFCNRFVAISRDHKKNLKHLTVEELDRASVQIYILTQKAYFSEEIASILKNGRVQNTSKLLSLNPFMDNNGIIRVGGRLTNSHLAYDERHPIIVPYGSHLSKLIALDAHHDTLHGGIQTTSAQIRRKYWIIKTTNTVKKLIRECTKCIRYAARTKTQIMGNLPEARVTPSRPFTNAGVDYAGPIQLRLSKGRGTKSYKGYIALFVCLATKAIHLEAVSDMTTDAFLAAYRRFSARRGKSAHIYSDNGTNFIGAKNIIAQSKYVANKMSGDGTCWHLIPPAAPHFGGIWEAGVKSAKHHLIRIMGDKKLTFEELTTLLCQIEAILNSRPMYPLTNNQNDFGTITPGHFLIGQAIIAPPDSQMKQTSLLSRWNLIQRMYQDFWKIWSTEYLSRLQQRTKWKVEQDGVKNGDLVLIKNENMAPTNWAMGRIVATHPGDDGFVRAVTLKTSNTEMRRPISKICPLHRPIEKESLDTDTATVNNTQINYGSSLDAKSTIYGEYRRRVKSTHGTKATRNNSWIIGILVLIGFAMALAENNFNITAPKPGLYVEAIGHAKVKRGNLRLEVQLKMEDIEKDELNIEDVKNKTQNICQKTDESHCKQILHHLLAEADQVQQQILKLKTLTGTRQKRGLVGKLFESVFGVNDEVYADIESLQHNQNTLLETINRQHLQINMRMNETSNAIDKKLKLFQNKLNEGLEAISKIGKWFVDINSNSVAIQILATLTAAENYMNELKDKYDNLINYFFGKGHILDFMDIHTLDAAISNTKATLGSMFDICRIPQQKTEMIRANNIISIYGFLHIIEPSIYDLLHITPIPLKIGNSRYGSPELSVTTIAVNYNEQNYFELSREQLSDCVRIQEYFLCTPSVIISMETSKNCIITELFDQTSKTNCSIVYVEMDNIVWKHLAMDATWLYISPKPTSAAVICRGVREEAELRDVGIIKIKRDCYIKTKLGVLRPSIEREKMVLGTFSKATNMNMSLWSAPATIKKFVAPEIIVDKSDILFSSTTVDDTTHLRAIRHHVTKTTFVTLTIFTAVLIILVRCRGHLLRTTDLHDEGTLNTTEDFILDGLSTGSGPASNVGTLRTLGGDSTHV